MRRFPAVLAVILVVSCTGDGGATPITTTVAPETSTTTAGTTSTSTTPVTTTSTAPSTSTTAPTTSTTAPSTTTTANDDPTPEGSGCTPGEGELPDGLWYGQVDSYTSEGISFDLACFFSGDEATVAAAQDGEESPPPNDYYVRNQNPALRPLEVDPDTPVVWYTSGDPNDFVSGSFSDWTVFLDSLEFWLGIWVTISDGEVTGIEEQWVP